MGRRMLTVGVTYRDIIMTGVQSMPVPGQELQAESLLEGWGGIATMARVAARLGMETSLCSPVGDDEASARLLAALRADHIDTHLCERHDGWSLPTTVALATAHDRAMVTVEQPPPAAVGHSLGAVDADAIIIDLRDVTLPWIREARSRGARVHASRGFDETGTWGEEQLAGIEAADVWMLNDVEAAGFTGLDDPLRAARALTDRVPTVVVTRGAKGMVAVDGANGQEAVVDAFPTSAKNLTGAGDSALAAFACASLLGASLEQRLTYAAFVTSTILSRAQGPVHPPTADEYLAAAERHRDPRAGLVAELLRR